MRTMLIVVSLATMLTAPALASEPGQPQADPITSEPDLPAPLGCTDEGKLIDGACSKGQPVYVPDGKTIGYLRTTTTTEPTWPAETDEAIKASLNLQIVVLPDGTVTEIQPTFLRITLPGEEEQRMNPTEDKYRFVMAATDAVAKWSYAPPELDGQPVAVYGSVCVDFTAAAPDERKDATDR